MKGPSVFGGRSTTFRAGAVLSFSFFVATSALPGAQAAADTNLQDAALEFSLNDVNHAALPGAAIPHEAQLLQSVYARRGIHLLWSENHQLSRQGTELVDILLSVDTYGLRPGDYGTDLLAAERNRLARAGCFFRRRLGTIRSSV